MEFVIKVYFSAVVLVVLLATVSLSSAQLKPARCPTNKIAPHRKIPSWQSNKLQGRTFGGAFIDLLTPDEVRPQEVPQNDLQEKPQEDDPDDCGDIEDYDDMDLSSVSQKPNRRDGKQNQRFFFHLFNKPLANAPLTTRTRPPSTSAVPPALQPIPSFPTISPFWSGGLFGNNPYRPPRPENPSDNLKPVHEHDASESQTTYWPSLVGGPLGNIVGASPAIPTFPAAVTTPGTFGTNTQAIRYTRRPRPRLPNNENTVFGSFVDLFI